jgi:Skp family chaperone for outer membrane proteins
MAALGTGIGVGGVVWAQQGNMTSRAPLQTRIAVINLSQVIKNYKKFQAFEQDMKTQTQAIQRDMDAQKAQAIGEQKELEQPTLTAERRDQLERHIKQIQRQMQDSIEEAKQKMSKREFDQLVQTYKEVKDAVDAYARAYAIELVLQYNDAVGQEVYAPPHFTHKLSNRACMPIYVDSRMDITEPVTMMLNQKLASAAAPGAPRGN